MAIAIYGMVNSPIHVLFSWHLILGGSTQPTACHPHNYNRPDLKTLALVVTISRCAVGGHLKHITFTSASTWLCHNHYYMATQLQIPPHESTFSVYTIHHPSTYLLLGFMVTTLNFANMLLWHQSLLPHELHKAK